MTIIAGFDVSSRTIGYSIIDASFNPPKLVYCSFIKPPEKGSVFDRITKTQEQIAEILNEYKPDIIGVEQISQFFGKKGKSTAKTIISLARFNLAVGLVCHSYLAHDPAMFSVMEIRHGLKMSKELPKKEEIPSLLEKLLGIKFPYVYEKGETAEESFDMADSLAVATYTAKYVNELETSLQKPIDKTLPKKRLAKAKKVRKLQLKEYKQIVGKEWT